MDMDVKSLKAQPKKEISFSKSRVVRSKNKKNVVVVGLGYVGLPLALLADRKGNSVVGVDLNPERVQKVNAKQSPFADRNVGAALADAEIRATADWSAVSKADVIVICVPTPVYEDHTPNLEPVISACRALGPQLKRGQLVVLESTVNPGVSEEIVLPILEETSKMKGGEDFYLAHCPERINPGDENWNAENIPRVVGGLDAKSLELAASFYRSIVKAPVKEMGSLKEAEAVKIVENSFRDINIALVNELAMSFSKLKIDVVNVIEGAATKPFAFMPHYPGAGVGGHCIPVDPYYLIDYAKEKGFYHDFLSLARRINENMPAFTVDQVVNALNEKRIPMKGSEIAVLGLAYKPDIDDCRESPAFEIIRLLKEKGANLRIYDPFVPEKSTATTLETAVRGVHAALVVTAHSVFKTLTPEYFSSLGIRIVIDGRNCLAKQKFISAGIVYRGIGR